MSKYTLTIEGDFEKGDCAKCPIGAASDILKGKGIVYSCMYALGGGSKEFCPLEEVPDTNVGKKGKWIRKIDDDWFRWVECSLCGTKRFAPRDFCPNCGADMRGGKE